MGRPSSEVPKDIADALVLWISEGKTLREFCRQVGMPVYSTIYDWQDKDEEFATRIAHARDSGHEAIAQDCLEIADDDSRDVSGELEMPNGVAVQRDKLRIDTRLKLLAKWNPKKYGDKLDMNHSGNVGVALVNSIPRPERD